MSALSIRPIVKSLVAARETLFGGSNQWTWEGPNPDLEWFIKKIFPQAEREMASWTGCEAIASFLLEDVNRFLETQGSNYKMSESPEENPWYIAGCQKVPVSWKAPGVPGELFVDGETYPCVTMDPMIGSVHTFFTTERHPHPIIKIPTIDGLDAYLTIHEQQLFGLELLEFTGTIMPLLMECHDWGGVEFPMVTYKLTDDVPWIGDITNNGSSKLGACGMANQLSMNHLGAIMSSQFYGGGFISNDMKPNYQVNKPFCIWFQREESDLPCSIFWVDKKFWKDPENK